MPKSREQLKQEYITSLDSFISKNPTVGQLDTAKFRDFLIGLVEHESGFNPTARQGSYFGWYQTNKLDADPYAQHMNAFNHLNGLFNNTITKEDVQRARSLGINDSALMLKYWNQGNRVNNYLWNNKDSADGLGTLISNYGNDLTMPLDVYGYAMDNLYGDYTVKEGDNWFNIQKRVRIPGRDYATGGKDLWTMQKLSGVPFGSLKIGQSFNFGNQINNSAPANIEVSDRFKYLYDLSNKVNRDREYLINRYKEGGKTKKEQKPLIYTSIYDDHDSSESNPLSYKMPEDALYNLFGEPYIPSYPVEPIKDYYFEPTITYEKPSETELVETVETNTTEMKEENPTHSNIEVVNEVKTLPIAKGTVEFAHGITDVGNMQELINLMKEEGISFMVTSGNRPGALTKDGKPSNHGSGDALDIVPIKGQTWNDLFSQMRRSKRFLDYMRSHKLGILDERSKEVQAITGATGPHIHIGPDSGAVSNFKRMFG